MNRTPHPSPRKKPLRLVLVCVLAGGLVFSGYRILSTLRQGRQEQAAFDTLASSVQAPSAPSASDDAAPESAGTTDGLLSRLDFLHRENADLAGWLTLPNTNINYPVMATPNQPEYYLRRAFDKSYAVSGVPFVGAGCTTESTCFILYGHKMKSGTMFGTLDRYAKEDFWQQNKTFTFTTLTEQRSYEVFAAVQCRILRENETGFRYYTSVGDLDQTAYADLLDWLGENALYATGITPSYGQQIVILSTCSYHTDNGRFLIAARRIS